jgi:quercetin dioxygenase-like cupin family protein
MQLELHPAAARTSREGNLAHSFARDGFIGPLRVFSAAQCALIRRYLRGDKHPAPLDWPKGRAAADRFLYDLATRPSLLGLLRQLLGADIVLWGASVVARDPGQVHPWHTDIESAAPEGGFVSAWIGLRYTSRESALQLVKGSHGFGKTIQQVVQEHALHRGEASANMVLDWAREIDPGAEVVQPDMGDGEAILFDGRLWHGSDNTRTEGRRQALILQYAAARQPVHIPDPSRLEWPFHFMNSPRPPVIAVSGSAPEGVNRLVPAPTAGVDGDETVTARAQSLAMPLAEDPEKGWKRYPLFRGPTASLHTMSCHVSVLSGSHSPHPPHAHLDEELLIVLDGEAVLVVVDGRDPAKPKTVPMPAGSFVYYPSYQRHTIHSPGPGPVTYLMFKWQAAAGEAEQPLRTSAFHLDTAAAPATGKPFAKKVLLNGPTSLLKKLHVHVTDLAPGAGYPPHRDPYDVAIVVLSGTVETLGQTVAGPGVVYYAANELHGMTNVGKEPARYLVFEFHPTSGRLQAA